jgi:hypothetical protein
MPDRVNFSKQQPEIQSLAGYYNDVESSLKLYFSPDAQSYPVRFVGYSHAEVRKELQERLTELELASALTVLSAIEAAFRVDYLQRCYRKQKDDVSRAFRELHKRKGSRVSLEDEILEIWKNRAAGTSAVVAGLRAAFRFRHWLAHGRYWEPKCQKYDYFTVYSLAEMALSRFDLLGPDA